MSALSPEEDPAHLVEAFRRGLREDGFAENGELRLVIEFAGRRRECCGLPALATDLVNRRVNVLTAVGSGDPSALAAKRVRRRRFRSCCGAGGDPVQLGLVASLNRPGGNVTGLSLLTNLMEPERLGLLRDLAPRVSR